jgi:hypothetical protein
MAQRKKRVGARKGKSATRGKAHKRAKTVRKKAVKRSRAKTAPRKRMSKAKSKRAVAKKVAPAVETVIVDMVEEPVPGVTVVTEFEATRVRNPNATPE